MAPNQDWKDPKLDFPTRIARIYDADGPMAQMLNDFRPRPGQQEFAREVAKAIEGKTTLIADGEDVCVFDSCYCGWGDNDCLYRWKVLARSAFCQGLARHSPCFRRSCDGVAFKRACKLRLPLSLRSDGE